MPLQRVIAKRGFNNNQFAAKVLEINVSTLEAKYAAGETVNLESLREKSLAKGQFDVVKILGNGDLTKKLTVQGARVSQGAEEKITKAGGTVERV